MPTCANCGRDFKVVRMKGVYVAPPDDQHDECQRCWDADMDRNRI